MITEIADKELNQLKMKKDVLVSDKKILEREIALFTYEKVRKKSPKFNMSLHLVFRLPLIFCPLKSKLKL